MATQNKSSTPIKQHYISRFYLNWFADMNKKIWMYDREKDEYRNQNTKEVAVIKNFYTYLKEDDTKSYEVDKILEDIESQVALVFRKINKRKSLNREDRMCLAAFCVCLMTRTPEHKELLNEFATKSFREIIKRNLLP